MQQEYNEKLQERLTGELVGLTTLEKEEKSKKRAREDDEEDQPAWPEYSVAAGNDQPVAADNYHWSDVNVPNGDHAPPGPKTTQLLDIIEGLQQRLTIVEEDLEKDEVVSIEVK